MLGVFLMKTLLLAGVAVLFLATGAVYANDRLPDTIIGDWCFVEGPDFPNPQVYVHVPLEGCPENLVRFEQEGAGGCIFDKIERGEGNIFTVFSRCETMAAPITLEIIDGKLVASALPEG
jgi:hypothetical protein